MGGGRRHRGVPVLFPRDHQHRPGPSLPSPTATELFRSYASTPGQEFLKLRVPSALPYVFTGLKVAAGASVVGTIVGELPSGLPDGLGRQLLTFAYYYLSGPEKLYAAVLFSALLGIAFVALVALIERLVIPRSRRMPA